ncbi:unnamed protein product [Dovyalis caffra]|uniref:F-box/LRR-repeat protein 15-like leucin rich repeat domain-containing protein n=1 Tax=Dovyalis caffra TaxID=77055 RepID=A0AAV1SFQ4_9ROSI|nr:unnamed protein product [Dovyalis caffra]
MSQADVSYSCGSCGYPLNLTSSHQITCNIGSGYPKSIKKGYISFLSVDLSRFTQVDEKSAKKVVMEEPLSDIHTSIMHLPNDCLSIVFQFLGCSSDRDSFGLTCRLWLNIQNTHRRSLQFHCSLALPNASLSQRGLITSSFHVHRLLTRFQHLQYLSLSGCSELSDLCLTYLQSYASKLYSLSLDCCFGMTDNGLSLVAAGCSSLEVISLYRCNFTDAGLETLANGCSALRHINLSYCPLVSDRGLRALSQSCHQLEAVQVSHCSEVNGTGFQGCSPTLTHIDADSCKLEPEGIMAIVSGGGLEYLNVSRMNWWISGVTTLAAIGAGFATRLRILNLWLCRTVDDESIAAIAEGCPSLQEWNLALCHGVRIAGWQSIGINCNKLEKLHVNRCRGLCDLGLQALREGCKRLMVLYIGSTWKLSTTAIELFKLHRGNVEISREEITFIGPGEAIRR